MDLNMDILEKINLYSHTSNEIYDMHLLIELAVFMETDINQLNEAFDITGVASGIMKSLGIGAHSGGSGLVQTMAKAGTNVAQLIWYATKAAVSNDAEAKEKVKELANKEVKKEQIIDFLLRVDTLTLHTLTSPIHMIDALTGWHIWANIKGKVEDMSVKIKQAIQNLADAAKEVDPNTKPKIKSLMFGLVRLFGLENEKEIVKSIQ